MDGMEPARANNTRIPVRSSARLTGGDGGMENIQEKVEKRVASQNDEGSLIQWRRQGVLEGASPPPPANTTIYMCS